MVFTEVLSIVTLNELGAWDSASVKEIHITALAATTQIIQNILISSLSISLQFSCDRHSSQLRAGLTAVESVASLASTDAAAAKKPVIKNQIPDMTARPVHIFPAGFLVEGPVADEEWLYGMLRPYSRMLKKIELSMRYSNILLL